MKKKKELEDRKIFYLFGWGLIGIGVTVHFLKIEFSEFLSFFLLPCLFHSLTGLYCPGCGGTRSVSLLFRGELFRSFLFHPVVPYFVLLFGWFMISTTVEYISKGRFPIGMRWKRWMTGGAIILVVGNFLLKNMALIVFQYDLLK